MSIFVNTAMDISMRRSTAGGDDKWEGLSQVMKVTNDDMNDVDMEGKFITHEFLGSFNWVIFFLIFLFH